MIPRSPERGGDLTRAITWAISVAVVVAVLASILLIVFADWTVRDAISTVVPGVIIGATIALILAALSRRKGPT